MVEEEIIKKLKEEGEVSIEIKTENGLKIVYLDITECIEETEDGMRINTKCFEFYTQPI